MLNHPSTSITKDSTYNALAHVESVKTTLEDINNVMGMLYDYTAKDNPTFEIERANSLIFMLWERVEQAHQDSKVADEILSNVVFKGGKV